MKGKFIMRRFLLFTLAVIMLLPTLLFAGCSENLQDESNSQSNTETEEPTELSAHEKANISAALQTARNVYTEHLVENIDSDTLKTDGYIQVEQNGKTYYFAVVDGVLSSVPYMELPAGAEIINQ